MPAITVSGIPGHIAAVIFLFGLLTCAHMVVEAVRELWREYKLWRRRS